jgi:hypothetical protein
MTVCIAVACESYSESDKSPYLIMVSDTLLSMGATSSEALKARYLSYTWSVMLAGDDIAYAEDVITRARNNLKERSTTSLSDVVISITKAYKSVRIEQIEEQFLGSYNMDLSEFLAKGPDYPTPTRRQSLLDEIEKFDLGCEFLVAGFSSPTSGPYVFQIVNPGRYVPHSLVGYWAIGSGNINAITYLARRNQGTHSGFERSLYNAIAAKKLAEKAEGVGTKTTVYVLKRGENKVEFLKKGIIDAIVQMWEDEEAKVQPSNLKARIKAILNPPATPSLPLNPAPEKSESEEK